MFLGQACRHQLQMYTGCEPCRADTLAVQAFVVCPLGQPQPPKHFATTTEMGTCLSRRHTRKRNIITQSLPAKITEIYDQHDSVTLQASQVNGQPKDHHSRKNQPWLLIGFSEPKKNTPRRPTTSTNRVPTQRTKEQTTRSTGNQHKTSTACTLASKFQSPV